jgi:hypothetical protein
MAAAKDQENDKECKDTAFETTDGIHSLLSPWRCFWLPFH